VCVPYNNINPPVACCVVVWLQIKVQGCVVVKC